MKLATFIILVILVLACVVFFQTTEIARMVISFIIASFALTLLIAKGMGKTVDMGEIKDDSTN